jgi:hypothetical protein
MTPRVALLRRLPGGIYRRRLLDQLARATADAFGTCVPDWRSSSYSERLTAYAEFTAAEAARLASPGAPAADGRAADVVKERLHRNAADLGAGLRRRLGIQKPQEALEVLGLLYRQIGIEIGGRMAAGATGDGASGGGAPEASASGSGRPSVAGQTDIQVTRCFFAHHYSPSTCRVMSALDAGVIDGLFGGAALEFSQRITDGSPCCLATVQPAEVQP